MEVGAGLAATCEGDQLVTLDIDSQLKRLSPEARERFYELAGKLFYDAADVYWTQANADHEALAIILERRIQ